ncbi:xanthine dehydrogenase family protein subunit M [Moorella naiadis]|uniref:FAD binding domain-containing protein n=1 Tax=Moorella naiadis (nom. illeg.) TaxID=3093670 RepID=UPI003D9C8DA2
MEVLKVKTIYDTLELLKAYPGARVIAGGTDLVPLLKKEILSLPALIDISDVPELKAIKLEGDILIIGAGNNHARLACHPLVLTFAPLLARACARVGSPQVRNRGTLGGNLGTASPAGDTLPALVASGAYLYLSRIDGERQVAAERFFQGPNITDLQPGEIIKAVAIPARQYNQTGFYYKVGLRQSMSIALASVAGWLAITPEGYVEKARIVLGAVGPTIVCVNRCAALLEKSKLDYTIIQQAAGIVAEEVYPIDDIRATAAYRRQLAVDLVFKGLVTILKSKGKGAYVH